MVEDMPVLNQQADYYVCPFACCRQKHSDEDHLKNHLLAVAHKFFCAPTTQVSAINL